jgi:ribosomal-protein-alanine N-acetyltransferase
VPLRIESVSSTAVDPVSMLHRACFPDEPWDAGAIAQIMRMPGFVGRVAWQNDIPAGLLLALNLGEEIEILSLCVEPNHRRSGIASALLDALGIEAAARTVRCLVLEVAVDNVAAKALYAARGFIIVGHRRNYYRRVGRLIDALVLRHILAAAPACT